MIENILNEEEKRDALINLKYRENTLVEAGAGAGKTYILVNRILNQVGSGEFKIHEIVAITFTNKAAGEMKSRIQSDLVKRENSSTGIERERYREAIKNFHRMNISTIHSFLLKLISARPLDCGLGLNYTIVDELERDREIAKLFGEFEKEEFLKYLNPRAATIFNEVKEKHEVLYGFKDAYLKPGYSTPSILDLDLEPYTIEEYSDDLDTLFRELYSSIFSILFPTRGILLKDAYDILMNIIKHGSNTRLFNSYMEDLARYYLKRESIFSNRPAKPRDLEKEYFEEKKHIFKEHREEFLEAEEEIRESILKCYLIRREWIYGAYTNGLENFIDYYNINYSKDFAGISNDDIIYLGLKLIEKESPRKYFQNKYKYFYIDEFQDTDLIQSKIFLSLISTNRGDLSTTDIGDLNLKDNSIFLVGDPKQSIYRFRGADLNIYFDVKNKFIKGENSLVVELNKSFRYNKNLADYFYELFKETLKDKNPTLMPIITEKPKRNEGLYGVKFPIVSRGKLEEEFERLYGELIEEKILVKEEYLKGIKNEAEDLFPEVRTLFYFYVKTGGFKRYIIKNFEKLEKNNLEKIMDRISPDDYRIIYGECIKMLVDNLLEQYISDGEGKLRRVEPEDILILTSLKSTIESIENAMKDYYKLNASTVKYYGSLNGVISLRILMEFLARPSRGTLLNGIFRLYNLTEKEREILLDFDEENRELEFKDYMEKFIDLPIKFTAITKGYSMLNDFGKYILYLSHNYSELLLRTEGLNEKKFEIEVLLNLLRENISTTSPIILLNKIMALEETEVPINPSEGIRIMNIHKSKGLEGEIVILVEDLAKTFRKGTYFDYETKKGYYSFAGERNYGNKIEYSDEEIFAKDEFENSLEKTRLDYVATTRAKEALFIISKKGRNSKYYTGENIGSSLFRIQPGGSPPLEIYREKTYGEEFFKERKFDYKVKYLSPSKLEKGESVEYLFREELRPYGKEFGTIFHSLMEKSVREYIKSSSVDLEENLKVSVDEFLYSTKINENFLKTMGIEIPLSEFQSLNHGEKSALVKNAISNWTIEKGKFVLGKIIPRIENAERVWTEMGFYYYEEGTLVHGYMDLVLKNGDCYEILDYKSNLKYDSEVSQQEVLTGVYENQMRIYKRALSKILEVDEKNIMTEIIDLY